MKTLVKTWSELYQAFIRCAALVTTAESNQCCEELASRILEETKKQHKESGDKSTKVCVCFLFVVVELIPNQEVQWLCLGTLRSSMVKLPEKVRIHVELVNTLTYPLHVVAHRGGRAKNVVGRKQEKNSWQGHIFPTFPSTLLDLVLASKWDRFLIIDPHDCEIK